jgi:tetratricopeptide (TPR) repeat protein
VNRFFLIISVILFPVLLHARDNGNDIIQELSFKGNRYYMDGKYEDALNTYLEILQAGYESGNLYYNMGNACYRLNMLGHAVLYYEKALFFIPRDPDLKFNLYYIRKLTKDAVDPPKDMISGILFWTGSMTVNELFLLFAVINLLFWCLLIIRLFIKKEWTFYIILILLAVWIITGISWAWETFSDTADDRAVVLPEEINVFSGPDEREKLLFQLHAGTIVVQERKEDNWKLIRLDEKRGWVRHSDIEKIVQGDQ